MPAKLLSAAFLLVVSLPTIAQPTQPGAPTISASRGQDEGQLARDRYECYVWAKGQSGFDPAQPGTATDSNLYRRAFTACMTGRGYTVSYPAAAPSQPPTAIPSVIAARPVYVRQYWWESPELVYRPVHFAIEGGYTATAGSTSNYLNDGGNVGIGFSFFPSRTLPLGLRIDGSWSQFDAGNAYYYPNGNYYLPAHENIYGGDADLQFNLVRTPSRYQFYLLGGAGWYREQNVIGGYGCGYYYCGPYSGEQSSTTGWRTSWNAGFGGEVATPGGTSFFIELRYQRIAPQDNERQFVPLRVGIRF
jgi:hypothetical protein